MGLTASAKDTQAYAKIGGAMDNLSDSYTYVARGLSVVNDSRNPLTNTGRVSKYLKFTGTAQRVYSYVRKIQEVIDEKKRDGGLLKLGFKISIDVAGKLLGTSLTTHPYYAYHKAMIDVLADALNADRNSRAAVEAYRQAVSAANSKGVADEFKRLESKKVDTVSDHFQFKDQIGTAADIARGLMSDEMAKKKKIAQNGSALSDAMADLETWRANWAGLSFDVMQLQIMAGNELSAAEEAMRKVKDLMATLMEGSNTNRVAGYGATNNIEWEKYDQIVTQKKPSQSLMDPVKFAQGNFDKATAWAKAFTEMCDFVRSEDVIYSSKFNHQLVRLNDVLYH